MLIKFISKKFDYLVNFDSIICCKVSTKPDKRRAFMCFFGASCGEPVHILFDSYENAKKAYDRILQSFHLKHNIIEIKEGVLNG